MADHEQMQECMAKLGVALDEELREKVGEALDAEPLRSYVVRAMTLLELTNDPRMRIFIIQAYALAVWQHGYRAAPKLEFVLPEGAGG